ncbi:hypothetical protein PR202_ga29972 [Eleusine coracana subsp. coracana]|uniref:Uncharacterized protein n=1 Tax=Eleusine coracana subsp. coracana TaxID=191504 RepID=A0AAV5DNF4_ELECO|nr:hypothetical protein PR202_ga29972 [Eleusine coracana subsp. coracana]
MPRTEDVEVDFDPIWFEHLCMHAAGNIYWHIGNSGRMFRLDPRTLDFSFFLAPAELGDNFRKYRIGEAPEDGSLCMASILDQQPATLCADVMKRHLCTWLSDFDGGRTGKVFIKTWGYGRYSYHLETGKFEHLETDDGLEHSDPIYAYFLAWPPAFLASPEEPSH